MPLIDFYFGRFSFLFWPRTVYAYAALMVTDSKRNRATYTRHDAGTALQRYRLQEMDLNELFRL